MKITRITPMVLGTAWRNLTFLKVETDEGLTGVGEARSLKPHRCGSGLPEGSGRNHVLGSDPFEIESLVNRMYRGDFGRAGEIVMTGIALVEMACWDIMGKALNQPVYRLLGGAVRERIKAYANGWYTVERTPEEFAKAAKLAVAKGYHALKLDPFGSGFYELERTRNFAPSRWSKPCAMPSARMSKSWWRCTAVSTPPPRLRWRRHWRRFKPSWFEEPVPPENLAALQKVSQAIAPLGIPIATGERIHTPYDFRELLERQAADIIQVDITHYGGLLNTKKLAAWADAYYVLIAPHNVGGPVSTAAALHFAACTTNFKIQEHFNDFCEPYVKEAAPGNPEVVDGYFALPQGPGLGVTLNEDVLRAHPRKNVYFNLYADDWHKRQSSQENPEE